MKWTRGMVAIVVASLAVLAVVVQQAEAHHDSTIPTKVSVIRAIYPDLYKREVAATPTKWAHLRLMARSRWERTHKAEALIHRLDAHPTPAGNRRLAQLVLSPEDFEGMDRIASGGDGIGGLPGESDWRENVWNGGKLGYDGGNPGPAAQSCSATTRAYAYGLGQACPAEKMLWWARDAHVKDPERVFESPLLQLRWARSYAGARCGGLAACGQRWSITRSW